MHATQEVNVATLLLRLKINLEEEGVLRHHRYHGPLFHRWLPDGKRNAITLITKDTNVELKIWFERYGYEDDGFIRFDANRREVNSEIMRKQAILDGGPLIGLVNIRMSSRDLAVLSQSKIGDSNRIAFGKRVVRLIQPPVAQFLRILRTTYGQYWLPELREWDSRRQTLGHYCNSPLQLDWSCDSGKTWTPFMPEELTIILRVPERPDFKEYLTETDWQKLAETIRQGPAVPLSSLLITQARLFLNQGELKHALIEGVSALEVAVADFLRRQVATSPELVDSVQPFFQLKLACRVVAIIGTLGTVSQADLELVVTAIKKRHKVVHEGWNPPESIKKEVDSLLRTAAALLPGPRFRFPALWYGNELKSPEEWNGLREDTDSAQIEHYGDIV